MKKVLVEFVVKSTRPEGVVTPDVAIDMTVAVHVEVSFTFTGVEHATVVEVGWSSEGVT